MLPLFRNNFYPDLDQGFKLNKKPNKKSLQFYQYI